MEAKNGQQSHFESMDLLCSFRNIFPRNLYVGVLLFSSDRRYQDRVKFLAGDQFDCPLFS